MCGCAPNSTLRTHPALSIGHTQVDSARSLLEDRLLPQRAELQAIVEGGQGEGGGAHEAQ